MAEKAILITKSNKERLEKTYDSENGTGPALAVGYYLVAGFGDHLGYEIISQANFEQKYAHGDSIRNGFFEAVKR